MFLDLWLIFWTIVSNMQYLCFSDMFDKYWWCLFRLLFTVFLETPRDWSLLHEQVSSKDHVLWIKSNVSNCNFSYLLIEVSAWAFRIKTILKSVVWRKSYTFLMDCFFISVHVNTQLMTVTLLFDVLWEEANNKKHPPDSLITENEPVLSSTGKKTHVGMQ